MSNTDKYILAGVIFFIVVATIILVYLNLRRRHKDNKDHKDHKHSEAPCPTKCVKNIDDKKDDKKDDEEDCKCGV